MTQPEALRLADVLESHGTDPHAATRRAHVGAVFPECRAQMANYLAAGVDVVIGPQTECGPDVPPIAIAVASDQAFWIDCCETADAAKSRAQELGLRVVETKDKP